MLYFVDNFKLGRSLTAKSWCSAARYIKVTGQLRTALSRVFTLYNVNSRHPVKVLLGIAWPEYDTRTYLLSCYSYAYLSFYWGGFYSNTKTWGFPYLCITNTWSVRKEYKVVF